MEPRSVVILLAIAIAIAFALGTPARRHRAYARVERNRVFGWISRMLYQPHRIVRVKNANGDDKYHPHTRIPVTRRQNLPEPRGIMAVWDRIRTFRTIVVIIILAVVLIFDVGFDLADSFYDQLTPQWPKFWNTVTGQWDDWWNQS